jgi:hypothetical protein
MAAPHLAPPGADLTFWYTPALLLTCLPCHHHTSPPPQACLPRSSRRRRRSSRRSRGRGSSSARAPRAREATTRRRMRTPPLPPRRHRPQQPSGQRVLGTAPLPPSQRRSACGRKGKAPRCGGCDGGAGLPQAAGGGGACGGRWARLLLPLLQWCCSFILGRWCGFHAVHLHAPKPAC